MCPLSIDSTLVESKGPVWHKSSSMEKDIVPRSGIDTEICQMGLQPYKKGWIFGYKLHLISSTGSSLSIYLSIGGCYNSKNVCMTIKSLSSTNIPFTCHNN